MSIFYSAFLPTATPLGISQSVEVRENPFGLTLPQLEARQTELMQRFASMSCGMPWKHQVTMGGYIAAIQTMTLIRDGVKPNDATDKEYRTAAQKIVNKGLNGTLEVKATNMKLCAIAGISLKSGRKCRAILQEMGLLDFDRVAPGSTFEPPTLRNVRVADLAILLEGIELSLRTYAGMIGYEDETAAQICTDTARESIRKAIGIFAPAIPLFNALTENVAQYNRDIKERVNRAAEELGKLISAGIDMALDILPSPDIPDFEQTPSLFGWNAQARQIMRKYRSNRMKKAAAPA